MRPAHCYCNTASSYLPAPLEVARHDLDFAVSFAPTTLPRYTPQTLPRSKTNMSAPTSTTHSVTVTGLAATTTQATLEHFFVSPMERSASDPELTLRTELLRQDCECSAGGHYCQGLVHQGELQRVDVVGMGRTATDRERRCWATGLKESPSRYLSHHTVLSAASVLGARSGMRQQWGADGADRLLAYRNPPPRLLSC